MEDFSTTRQRPMKTLVGRATAIGAGSLIPLDPELVHTAAGQLVKLKRRTSRSCHEAGALFLKVNRSAESTERHLLDSDSSATVTGLNKSTTKAGRYVTGLNRSRELDSDGEEEDEETFKDMEDVLWLSQRRLVLGTRHGTPCSFPRERISRRSTSSDSAIPTSSLTALPCSSLPAERTRRCSIGSETAFQSSAARLCSSAPAEHSRRRSTGSETPFLMSAGPQFSSFPAEHSGRGSTGTKPPLSLSASLACSSHPAEQTGHRSAHSASQIKSFDVTQPSLQETRNPSSSCPASGACTLFLQKNGSSERLGLFSPGDAAVMAPARVSFHGATSPGQILRRQSAGGDWR